MTRDEHDAAMAGRDRPVTQPPIRRRTEHFPDGFSEASLIDNVVERAQAQHDLRRGAA
jgi:hypothetical protein